MSRTLGLRPQMCTLEAAPRHLLAAPFAPALRRVRASHVARRVCTVTASARRRPGVDMWPPSLLSFVFPPAPSSARAPHRIPAPRGCSGGPPRSVAMLGRDATTLVIDTSPTFRVETDSATGCATRRFAHVVARVFAHVCHQRRRPSTIGIAVSASTLYWWAFPLCLAAAARVAAGEAVTRRSRHLVCRGRVSAASALEPGDATGEMGRGGGRGQKGRRPYPRSQNKSVRLRGRQQHRRAIGSTSRRCASSRRESGRSGW